MEDFTDSRRDNPHGNDNVNCMGPVLLPRPLDRRTDSRIGGITFSGSGYPVEDNRWYFGFDCAHAYDAFDLEAAKEYGFNLTYCWNIPGSTVKTKEYVRDECHKLAKQLNDYQSLDRR